MLASFARELWTILTELSLWLFLGALLASLVKILLPPNFVSRHIGSSRFSSVFKSVLVGVPLPLCSCGVIPTTVGLKKDGASDAAAVGFLISTPQTGLDSMMVTGSFLGWPLALFKVGAAFITGLIGGWAVQGLGEKKPPEPVQAAGGVCPLPPEPQKSSWKTLWRYAVDDMIRGVYRYLILGILVAALISWLVPPDYISRIPALHGWLGMLVMLVVAMPLYVCSTGSVPIAASLIHAGMPLGSALVFLMAGPATNAATMGAVYKIFGRRVLLIYLGVIIAGSLIFGLLFEAWFGAQAGSHLLQHAHHASPFMAWLNAAAAVLLTWFLVQWGVSDLILFFKKQARPAQGTTSETIELTVQGMTCGNCVNHVRQDLQKVDGVKNVDVTLENGLVRVYGNRLNREKLIEAVQAAGYQVLGCEA